MKERSKTRVAGSLSLAASIITLVIYGLLALAIAGYSIFIIIIIGGIADAAGGSGSGAGKEGVLMVLIVLAIFGPLIAMGILGCVFGAKMKRMGLINDGSFYFHKKKLITYDVFLYVFAVISIVVGVYSVVGGNGPLNENDGEIIGIVAKIPFSFISGVLYLISAILLSIDIAKNKENFKLAKEGRLTIQGATPVQPQPQVVPQQPVQPQASQPEIITLKKGEEIPEHLKGRLVPVEPKEEQKQEPKTEQKEDNK